MKPAFYVYFFFLAVALFFPRKPGLEDYTQEIAGSGTQTAYHFGNDASKLGEYAWYYGNSENHLSRSGRWNLPNSNTRRN